MSALIYASGLLTGITSTALLMGDQPSGIGILYLPAFVMLAAGVILLEGYNRR